MKKWIIIGILGVVVIGFLVLRGCESEPQPGHVLDEALAGGYQADFFVAADEDYFADMDKGYLRDTKPEVVLNRDEVIGRNNWNVFTGGNDRFWDHLANTSFGSIDLLKTLSSHPSLTYCGAGPNYQGDYDYNESYGSQEASEDGYVPYNPADNKGYYSFPRELCENDNGKGEYVTLKASRENRWKYFGLVNEPCFSQATGPHPDFKGLWFDVRDPSCDPDPFENAEKYKPVRIGARGKNIDAGSNYGYASGILGLRIFPNPAFDAEAEANWDPVRFYEDASYYNDSSLVRPYRVGMSCGFCHIGPSPVNPPDDPENPEFANLNSNPGAQYFWIDRIFFWNPDAGNFAWQLFHTSPPGALDTSFVSTDNINNPRTMNAVYSIGARLQPAYHHVEKLQGGSDNNAQFNDYAETRDVPAGNGRTLSDFYDKATSTVRTPHVLKDGADSVGILGALNRVYLNIGLFSEEWLLHFNQLVGGKEISPIEIAVARKNSTYWNANELQTPSVALFFAKTATPDHLRDAPGAANYQQPMDSPQVTRGREVFAVTCARCHSGKLPPGIPDDKRPEKAGQWDAYWEYSKTDEFKSMMTEFVMDPDFMDNNFFSTEVRVPVTLLETNACSPLATNAITNDIWDNFSSQSYKELESVGSVTVQHPFTGEEYEYEMPGGGRGFTRPASLISLWSQAPYLLNNSVGEFHYSPSVGSRMASFQDSIEKMLWPEKRKTDRDVVVDELGLPESWSIDAPGYMYRTTHKSYLKLPLGNLPKPLDSLLGWTRHLPWVNHEDMKIEIGPIPKGTPVNFLANINPLSEDRSLSARADHAKKVLAFARKAIKDLKALPQDASDEEARDVFSNLVDEGLVLNKCPDFIVNKGHYFGTDYFDQEPGLSDDDKYALIEFLKWL